MGSPMRSPIPKLPVRRGIFLGAMLALSGCAAVPLVFLAGTGAAGFAVHKVVQTQSGGSVKVAFPSEDGHEAPAQALPPGQKVAVLPGGERERHFIEGLQASGEFIVIPLVDAATAKEDTEAFASACRKTGADLVFAARDGEVSKDKNFLSFGRGVTTYMVHLFGFSCVENATLWREQMALIIEHGSIEPTASERAQVAGELWAERVVVSKNMGRTNEQPGGAS